MDDYSLSSLSESKNEWCARLVSLLTHHIIIGIDSIFNEGLEPVILIAPSPLTCNAFSGVVVPIPTLLFVDKPF